MNGAGTEREMRAIISRGPFQGAARLFEPYRVSDCVRAGARRRQIHPRAFSFHATRGASIIFHDLTPKGNTCDASSRRAWTPRTSVVSFPRVTERVVRQPNRVANPETTDLTPPVSPFFPFPGTLHTPLFASFFRTAMADTEMPPVPLASEPVTLGLDPLPAVTTQAGGFETTNAGVPASSAWPPTKPAQSSLDRGEILLTPAMAAKGPKGHAWVSVHEYDAMVAQWEERKRFKKTPNSGKTSSSLMPPPRKKTPSGGRAAHQHRPVYVPEPEPEPEVLDFTGLSDEEIKAKKKEAKRREKARIIAQLAAIDEAKLKLNTVDTRTSAPPANREGKRAVKAPTGGAADYFTGELSTAQLNAAPNSSKKRKTVKQAKRGKDGKVITHRSLKIDEVEENRAWRMKALMREARECFSQTRKHKYAWVFGKPVDPIALHIPDYFDIIKEPMDFGTVKDKLDRKQYANGGGPMEFAHDMRQVFVNCATYNSPESDAGLMGSTLAGEFEKAWLTAKLDEKVAEEDGFRAEEDEIISQTSADAVEEEVLIESQQVSEVNRQLAEVQKQLAELQKRQAMAGGGGGYAPPPSGGRGGDNSKRKRSIDDNDYFVDEEDIDLDDYIPAPRGGSRRGGGGGGGGGGHRSGGTVARSRGGGGGGGGGGALPSRDMTYKEKQELTELLGELPEDKQARVVQIVAERHTELGGNQEDLIEINIEELDSVTLWKLDRFVRSCLKPKKKKQTQDEMLLEAQRMEQEAERELMQVEASLGVGTASAPAAAPSSGKTPSVSAPGAVKGADSDATSSSSDSGSSSDSDSDSYDSAEGGGSNPKDKTGANGANGNGGGGGPAAAKAGAGGASAVEVSSSRPVDDGVALKQNASKAAVTVTNQAGWANLATPAGPIGGDPVGGKDAGNGSAAIPDALWSDFEAMAQQKSDREKEREREEVAEKAAAVAKESAAVAEEERKKRAAIDAELAEKQAEQDLETAKKALVEEERAKQRAALEAAPQTVDMEGQREAMAEFEG